MKRSLKLAAVVTLTGALLIPGVLTTKGHAADGQDVPLRQIVDTLNGTVSWSGVDQSIQVNVGGDKAVMKLDSTDAAIKGKAVKLDKKPYLSNGSTYISSETAMAIKDALSKKDKLLFTFSTVGDSRSEPGNPELSDQDNKWLVNSKVMTRMGNEMRAKDSTMLFYNGDMIMGYTPNSDINILNREYAFWRGLTATMFENGMYVFPVPGNHEVQDKYKDDAGKTVKIATKANEDTWRDNMGDIILDKKRFAQILGEQVTGWDPSNYPQIGMDHITTDQSQLSYSFDYRGAHFVIINTDPKGNDSHAPIEWLDADIKKAKARGLKHTFVFGHKMAYTYKYDPSKEVDGLEVDPAGADTFWNVIQNNNATYFSGHEHIFNVIQPKNGKAYQVLVGSGGSPFEATKPTGNPIDQYYAYVTVSVYESGKVHLDAYGFDANYGPTLNIKSWDLEDGF